MGRDLHNDDGTGLSWERLEINCQAGLHMTRELLEDRLSLLRELIATEHDLAAIEAQHGRSESTLDLFARLYAVRLQVLDQLRVPAVTDAPNTIH
jgi:hypothetical protein